MDKEYISDDFFAENDNDIFDEQSVEIKEGNGKNVAMSILDNYSDELTAKTYVTNPAISREKQLKDMILILLSPEKSVVLTGPAGVGKTSLVEGLALMIQQNKVPNVLQNFKIYKINTSSLLGNYEHDGIVESKLQLLINEVIDRKNTILFIDEVHTLVTAAKNGGGVDFLNMLKPCLDRGDLKIIGATTTKEYEEFLLKDKAFIRRFEKVEIPEPDEETTVKIVMGTKKKIELATGVIFPYSDYLLEQIAKFIVSITSKYKRRAETGSNYPDIALSLFSSCFTFARFDNAKEVNFKYIYEAIKNTRLIYPDVVAKALPEFKEKFKEWMEKEGTVLED
ncbi:MAG: AAA family ATPase [Bacilli bacterium]|nr:AAA family ATPase [Bacilli bacterium]